MNKTRVVLKIKIVDGKKQLCIKKTITNNDRGNLIDQKRVI